MIAHQTIGSARAETSRRNRTIIAGAFALAAMLLPNAALGMDSTPQQTAARAIHPPSRQRRQDQDRCHRGRENPADHALSEGLFAVLRMSGDNGLISDHLILQSVEN